MLRRIAALGTPPLLLMLATLLLVRYQPLILDTLWGGRLPQAWCDVLHHLPLVLTAAGLVAGLRMHSCGVLIVMGALTVLAGVYMPAGILGVSLAPEGDGVLPALRILLPVCYLLAYGTLGHSWQSRRGLAALALVAATVGGLVYAAAGEASFPSHLMRVLPWPRELPTLEGMRLQGWYGLLPAIAGAGFLAVGALRAHDPLAAGLSASLLLVASALRGRSDPIALSVIVSAAVLSVLVGLLESMWALAYRDGLTGLPGRRGLNRALGQLGGRYAIAMLDVDHFKRFNDRFGHRTGDDVLKMIAARMRRIPGGRPFRYGGEEFAVLFSGRAARTAAERMEHFRASLARTPFVLRHLPRADKRARGRKTGRTVSHRKVTITVSIGLAQAGKLRGKATEVMASADKALYKAKRTGRNRVVTPSGASRRA